MPLDTSIPLQFGQTAPTQAINPMTIYQAMQDRQANALRAQLYQQEMAKNAMAMQNTEEDRRIAAATRAEAARRAAEERRLQVEFMRDVQSGFTPAKNAIIGPGTIQGSTPAQFDPTAVKNRLLARGNVGGLKTYSDMLEQLAKQQEAEGKATGQGLTNKKIEAETAGVLSDNDKKKADAIKAGLDNILPAIGRAGSPEAVLTIFDNNADTIRAIGQDPDQSKRDFLARLEDPKMGATPQDRFNNAVMMVSKGVMDTQKHISDMLTGQAGRTDVVTGADGNTYLLDKDTGNVRPTTMAAAAGAPAAAPTSFRAAPTTDAQIKQAAAKEALPGAVEAAELTLAQLEEMVGSKNLGVQRDPSKMIPEHPGFQSAVGGTLYPLAGYFSGTDTSDFNKRLEQVKGGAFLKAYETLKGTGQITEKEGEKATAAITRMDTAQSEKEFILAAKEFKSIIESAIERAKTKMRGSIPAPAAANAAAGGGNTPNVTPNGVSYSVEE